MRRLINGLGKNSPEEYNNLFHKEADWQDLRRWKTLLKHYKGGNIVDIGCLNSDIPLLATVDGYYPDDFNYLGTDTADAAVKEMRKRYSDRKMFNFIVDDVYNTKIKDEVADYLIIGEVLEHLENPGLAIKTCLNILKPGGILAISVPLDEAMEPGAVDLERHVWSFDKQDFRALLNGHKLKFKVLRSKWFPKYKYCWPTLVVWAIK